MANHINFLQNHLSMGKSAKEVLDALKELGDVSVPLDTALQHLPFCAAGKFHFAATGLIFRPCSSRYEDGHLE